MKKIEMVDLQGQYLKIKHEIDGAIEKVLLDSKFIQGPEVKNFSAGLAAYSGSRHVVTCANGTDALQIAMMALGLMPDDEVILPVHTYVATAEVIALLRLKPVFVDVHPETFNLDVTRLADKLTKKTRAIVPVHLYGQSADMEPILNFARANNLAVIEDTAQALGARYTFSDGTVKQAGTIGTIGTTSFFPSKNLGCFGDGGAIFTQDDALAERIQMIANHGQRKKYFHELVGINSRLDTLQAAILEVKLRHLPKYEQSRQEVAAGYDQLLNNVQGLIIPARSLNSTHVFHQYTIRAERRDELKAHLERLGIPSMIYYPVPLHLQPAYQQPGFGKGSFPVAEQLSASVLSLPVHTEMNPEQLRYICDSIISFYRG